MILSLRFIITSLILHALLLAIFYNKRHETKKNVQEVILQFNDPSTEPKSSNRLSHRSPKKFKYFTSLGRGTPHANTASQNSAPTGSPLNSYQTGEAFNEMEFQDFSANINFYSSLWTKIRNRLDYPQDFADERIEGLVKVQITVDRKGQIKKGTLYAYSDKKLLEAYSVIGIASALSEPLPKNQWNDLDEITLEIFIDYKAVVTNAANAYPDKGNFLKNQFYFVSTKKVRPKVLEQIEYYYDRYVPPVIIYPGGFYVDFVQAYRMYIAYTTPDPLERRKNRVAMDTERLKRLMDQIQINEDISEL